MKLVTRVYKKYSPGFTLVEVLLVIGILGVLASTFVFAINPQNQFVINRDAQRKSDMYSILNALYQYKLDNEGSFPETISAQPLEICRTASNSCEGKVDLSSLTNDEAYLIAIPIDPSCVAGTQICEIHGTGYVVEHMPNGGVTIRALFGEGSTLSVTH